LKKNAPFDVSVVVAVRDEENYIEASMNSILGQRGLRHEVIVVDDNSSDSTGEKLKKFARRHKNLKVLSNTGKGKCRAYNLGVALSKGRFICLFAGDDVMPCGSLRKRWSLLRRTNPLKPVVGLSKLVTFSNQPRYDGHVVPKKKNRGGLVGTSYLFNRRFADMAFPVPASLPNEDTWLELAVTHFSGVEVIHSGVIGNQYRVHEGNSINMMQGFAEYHRKYSQRREALFVFYKRHARKLGDLNRRRLFAQMNCELARRKGDLWGIFLSAIGHREKLRAISCMNPLFFWFRRTFYGLASGW